jgi:hypothetical protein
MGSSCSAASHLRRSGQLTPICAVPDRDYSHRDVLDKLGIKPGQAVALAMAANGEDAALAERIVERAGRPAAGDDEPPDVVVARVGDAHQAAATLLAWRTRIQPDGAIWLLTAKRGRPEYVDQRLLIVAGLDAGMVDNKSCSVSDTTSGMRFVIRRRDRPQPAPPADGS